MDMSEMTDSLEDLSGESTVSEMTGLSQDSLENLDEMLIEMMGALESTTEVTVDGTSEVKGVECYSMTVTPDPATLMEQLMGLLDEGGLEDLADLGDEDIGDIIKDYSAKLWFAKDGGMLMKLQVDLSLEMEGETSELSLELIIYDINESVDVEVPQEAQDNAMDFTELLTGGGL
jgi:hypothetical protein